MGLLASKGHLHDPFGTRAAGVPLTKSGRQRNVGKMLTGGGNLLPVTAVALMTLSACAEASSPQPIVNAPSPTARATPSPLVTEARTFPPPSAPSTTARVTPAGRPPGGPVFYPASATQSPITNAGAANLRARAIAGSHAPNVFAKVGESNTVSTSFLHCFAGSKVGLGAATSLQATLDHFRGGHAAGTTPFDRVSLAASVGWSASAPLQGDPPYLAKELAAIDPRFAIVMFGTNDIQTRNLDAYADNMLTLVDALLAANVVPIVSSIPPRNDDATADLEVPTYVAVARGVAQGREIPFVDLERELRALPGHGLGGDGIHMNTAPTGACDLTTGGLAYGFNVRNLVTLTAFDRLRRAAFDSAPAPDPAALVIVGTGSPTDPIVVPGLPFSDVRNTKSHGQKVAASYSCGTQNEGGPEIYYRLDLAQPTKVRAVVLDRGDADIDVHLLGASPSADRCVARDNREIVADLAAGTHWFSLDTFVSGAGKELAGEYVFVILPG
jgi:hypothetical protein